MKSSQKPIGNLLVAMPLTVVDEKFNPSGFQQARSFRSPSELAALFLVNE
jgi:hypothetical protein